MTPARIRARWDEVRIGFMILTRIPVGRIQGEAPSMAASAWCWPLVGLVVGGVAALVWWIGLGLGLTPVLAATLAVTVMHQYKGFNLHRAVIPGQSAVKFRRPVQSPLMSCVRSADSA